jgi:hypothetical protein
MLAQAFAILLLLLLLRLLLRIPGHCVVWMPGRTTVQTQANLFCCLCDFGCSKSRVFVPRIWVSKRRAKTEHP